jgi:integrase
MCIFEEEFDKMKNHIKTGLHASDYINFDTALNKGLKLLEDPKRNKLGLYILVAIYTGLRTGDIQGLRFEDFDSEQLIIQEKKTGKIRNIKINDQLKKVIQRQQGKGLIFVSQKNTVFRTQSLNRMLKQTFNHLSKRENISTHSLRKSFGRRVYDTNGQSEHSLIKLSEIFGHSSIQLTRIYLGLKQEELNEVYMNL